MYFKIGELAKRVNCPVVTIRFYEKEGLLPEPERTEGNYRLYTQDHLVRLTFILRCRSLDMALDEVRDLLALKDAPFANCLQADHLLEHHIVHVAERIEELQRLEAELVEIRSRCKQPASAAACGILDELSHLVEGAASRPLGHVSRTHGKSIAVKAAK